MAMSKIKKGDDVIVIAGKDKGKRGTVLEVQTGRVLVENVNMVKRHTKANPNAGDSGGIVEKVMPLVVSIVSLFNASTNKADRVGFKGVEDGRNVSFFKSNNEVVDV